MLACKDLKIEFDRKPVLKGVTLTFPPRVCALNTPPSILMKP